MNRHVAPVGAALVTVMVIVLLSPGATGVASGQLEDQAPRGNWDTVDSTGEIVLDGSSYYSVYQGESDITGWRNVDGDDVEGSSLDGESGAAEGELLDLTSVVPRDQPTGRYSGDGLSARVRTPDILRMEIYNRNGYRIRSGEDVVRSDGLLVYVESNFAEAEDLELTVEDGDGVDVTREVLSTSPTSSQLDVLPDGFATDDLARRVQGLGSTGYERGYWLLDLEELSRGRHTVTVEGVQDLSFGRASSSFALDVGGVSGVSLVLSRSTASQGQHVRFDVTGSERGAYHAVAVPLGRVREGAAAEDVFREVADTVETGSASGHAYAVLEMAAGGSGTGQIDTSALSIGDTPLRLYEAADSVSGARADVGDSLEEIEERGLDVERGEISVNVGSIAYVTGQSIDLGGTASPGVDRVAVYVRDSDDWLLLPLRGRDTHPVGEDGSWGVRDVVLSEEDHGGRLFAYPGVYSIAAVDAADLESPPPRSIAPAEFNRLTTSRTSARVAGPGFVAELRDYGGEVAEGDRVSLSGRSVGPDEIAVAFVGRRGRVHATTVHATRAGGFFDVDLDLGDLGSGEVTMLALSPGRDGVYGTGSATDGSGSQVSIETPDELVDYLESFDVSGPSGSQVVSRVGAATFDRAGSDDLVRTQEFRVAAPDTRVRDVVPEGHLELRGPVAVEQGERFVVRGTTNRNPDDASVDVEIEGPSPVDGRTVTSWSSSGLWSVEYSSDRLELGEYTVRVDDGESTDSLTFDVVETRSGDVLEDVDSLRERLADLRRQSEEVRETNEELRDEIDELERERERLRQQLNETRERAEGSPGFGVLATAFALLVFALFAASRSRP